MERKLSKELSNDFEEWMGEQYIKLLTHGKALELFKFISGNPDLKGKIYKKYKKELNMLACFGLVNTYMDGTFDFTKLGVETLRRKLYAETSTAWRNHNT